MPLGGAGYFLITRSVFVLWSAGAGVGGNLGSFNGAVSVEGSKLFEYSTTLMQPVVWLCT